MPVIEGFGMRDGEGREHGASTLILSFPQARKMIAERNAETGAVELRSVANPHRRALTLPDIRSLLAKMPEGSELRGFYAGAEKMLLDHIETGATRQRGETGCDAHYNGDDWAAHF